MNKAMFSFPQWEARSFTNAPYRPGNHTFGLGLPDSEIFDLTQKRFSTFMTEFLHVN